MCIVPMPPPAVERVARAISDKPDWDSLLQRAVAMQVGPAVFTNLTGLPEGDLPAYVRERAAAELLTARAAIMGKVLAATHLLQIFGDAGITTIVLKGLATGTTAYGDPSLRDFADLDILLRPEEIPAARDLLAGQGFAPHFEEGAERRLLRAGHALEFMRPALKVELHTELVSRYLRVAFDLSEVWKTSRVVRCAGHDTRVLAAPVEFVFLAAHGAKHEWNNFRWICDIAQLVTRLSGQDRAAIVDLASRLHCSRLVALAAQLVHDAFGVDCGPELEKLRASLDTADLSMRVLGRIGIAERHAGDRISLLAGLHPAMPALLFWCSTRERWRDRVLSTADLIFKN